METRYTWFATAAFGLEGIVKRELTDLGMADVRVEQSRILFEADAYDAMRANLWLRASDRVYLHMATFAATTFDMLFEAVRALPWEEYIARDYAFPVVGHCARSQLMSLPDCQSIIKKAIVERLRSVYGISWFPETGPQMRVDFSLHSDVCVIALDASGAGLHKRGYRTLVGDAPIKETLAAALLLVSPWYPDRPFLDPYCGSGTIALEAAMIGTHRAPGLTRAFESEHWPFLPASEGKRARDDARDAFRPDADLCIEGSDIDTQAIELCKTHAKQAGLEKHVRWQRRDVRAIQAAQADWGVIVTNPPYGERLGGEEEAQAALRELGRLQKRLKTWSLCAITSVQGAGRCVGRPHDRVRRLFNGRFECGYYTWYGPRRPRVADGNARAEAGASED